LFARRHDLLRLRLRSLSSRKRDDEFSHTGAIRLELPGIGVTGEQASQGGILIDHSPAGVDQQSSLAQRAQDLREALALLGASHHEMDARLEGR